jgi:hypothetical protein
MRTDTVTDEELTRTIGDLASGENGLLPRYHVEVRVGREWTWRATYASEAVAEQVCAQTRKQFPDVRVRRAFQ